MPLPEPFSREGGAILYRGRAVKGVKIDADTFEVLGASHARDAHQVFLVMETKLKPIKRADAASFQSLGQSYGRDAGAAFFLDKPIRLKKGAGSLEAFRELDPHYATDGGWLYFGTQQVEPPKDLAPFDWQAAEYRPFSVNAVNRSDALLTDGRRTFLSQWGQPWVELQDVRLDAVTRLGEDLPGLHRQSYLTDGRSVWYRGERIDGIDARSARQLGISAVEDDRRVYVGAEPAAPAPGTLAWMTADLYRTEESLLQLSPGAPARTLAAGPGSPAPSVEAAFEALLRAVIAPAFTAFDRHLPLEVTPGDLDLSVPPPAGVPAFTVTRLPNGLFEVSSGDHVVTAAPSAWYSALSRLWSQLRRRADGHLVFVGHGTMMPDADSLQIQLAKLAFGEILALASALFEDPGPPGYRDEARALVHLALFRIDPFHHLRGVDAQILHPALARVPFELVGFARFDRPRNQFTATTNLAAAKAVIQGALPADSDVRVRWEAANLLNGVICDSPKTAAILGVALEAILDRIATEPVGLLVELWWAVLDSAAVHLTVSADIRRSFDYGLLARVARALIDGGVNVNQNRVRLVEALFGQGEEAEAEAYIEVLRAEDRSDLAFGETWRPWPTSGPYCHRTRFSSLESAALGACVRSLFRPNLEASARAASVDRLASELESLAGREAEHFGPKTGRPDLMGIADDLARLRG
ncbi:hypothetical protein Poly30_20860 [Planctomycetes bacterium Poly30]|uniref:DKNYY family protein n=1 Tax=Saltatorellus ferox TaxID=2528018 RepID=A0A518ER50_9BACT|nr:hypothetical protein Poly30_20860 [Planctomycetes bacterium Poly30]